MDKENKQTKRKPSLVMPFTLLGILLAGVITASILLRPEKKKTRHRQRPALEKEINDLIVGLLRAEKWEIRHEHIKMLRRATGMHYDYHPEHTEELRYEALTRWNDWWNEVKTRYDGKKLKRINWLLDALSDESYPWRHVIIPVITKTKDPRAVDLLIKALAYEGENSSRLKIESAKALGRLDNSAATPALLAAATDRDSKVAVQAARAVALIEPVEYVKQIVETASRKDIPLGARYELCMAAYMTDKAGSEAAFIAYCHDAAADGKAEFDLAQAVSAFATIGTEACLEVLNKLSAHPSRTVSNRAKRVRVKVEERIRKGAPK